jgi:hypothetical protein
VSVGQRWHASRGMGTDFGDYDGDGDLSICS